MSFFKNKKKNTEKEMIKLLFVKNPDFTECGDEIKLENLKIKVFELTDFQGIHQCYFCKICIKRGDDIKTISHFDAIKYNFHKMIENVGVFLLTGKELEDAMSKNPLDEFSCLCKLNSSDDPQLSISRKGKRKIYQENPNPKKKRKIYNKREGSKKKRKRKIREVNNEIEINKEI